MKELMFLIAEKIATDKRQGVELVCAGIMKEYFINEGYSSKQSNMMALDTIKILLKAMAKFGK